MEVEFILYVADQQRSKEFYEAILDRSPIVNVPGMSEFYLGGNVKLGLMPETGIKRILQDKTPDPASGSGIPRCELYLLTAEYAAIWRRAMQVGAKEISPIEVRNWGDMVGYFADLDGHIVAVGRKA